MPSCVACRSNTKNLTPAAAGTDASHDILCAVQPTQPYDAPTILEIDPVTHALATFGAVGKEPCKWYGGVLGPNNKIYAIPYASQFILEISPETKSASIFATVAPGWGKWSGGVLAGNGKIYGIPALATSLLEIDVRTRTVTPYGMLPGGEQLQDKWNGGVLAPNGASSFEPPSRVAQQCLPSVPPPPPVRRQHLRHPMAQQLHHRVRSGDQVHPPFREAHRNQLHVASQSHRLACGAPVLSLRLEPCSHGRHGGVCISNGRIVAVPYNSAQILEIGERVCMPSDDKTSDTVLQPAPTVSQSFSSMLMPIQMVANVATQTFILALPGCPDGNNGASCCIYEIASYRH